MPKKNNDTCDGCGFLPCRCVKGGGGEEDQSNESSYSQESDSQTSVKHNSVIEVQIFKPNSKIAEDDRGVIENLWLKESAEQYLSIGVYLSGKDLQYYFFEKCNKSPKIYSELDALKSDLPDNLKNIFDNDPKLFIMGHGSGSFYGLSNKNDDKSETISDDAFNALIKAFETAISKKAAQLTITLEACNTDDAVYAKKQGKSASFLELLSQQHQDIIFCGTAPWCPTDVETGFRASGGFPNLVTPIVAMAGSVWPERDTVLFHKELQQLAVRRSNFSSVLSAMATKTNTINYAYEFLSSNNAAGNYDEVIKQVCLDRSIVKIEDLAKLPEFAADKVESKKLQTLKGNESKIIEHEKKQFLSYIEDILTGIKAGKSLTDRDILDVALCLKDFSEMGDLSLLAGKQNLLNDILKNKSLLSLVMVSCGKVLIGGPSNNALIDLLLRQGVSINSKDGVGMTAMHYAVQCFYNYRQEPLALIRKLLSSGANPRNLNSAEQSPQALTIIHSQNSLVRGGEKLLDLIETVARVSWVDRQSPALFNAADVACPEVGSNSLSNITF